MGWFTYFDRASNPSILRKTPVPVHRSLRDEQKGASVSGLFIRRSERDPPEELVTLQKISVKASIDTFVADVSINQVFTNTESNTIEAVYVFPIEVRSLLSDMFAWTQIVFIHFSRKMQLSMRSLHRSTIERSRLNSKRRRRLNKNTKRLLNKDKPPCFSDKVNKHSTHSLFVSQSWLSWPTSSVSPHV